MQSSSSKNGFSLHSNELIAEMSQITKTGGWVFDIASQKLEWTKEVYRIYGLDIDTPVTPEIGIKHYLEESREIITSCFELAVKTGASYQEELAFEDTKGNRKWVKTTGKVIVEDGEITHVYGILEDITKEKQLIAHEKNAAHYLETVINHLNDAVITINESGIIISANRTTEYIFKCDTKDLIGQNISILMPKSHADLHHKYMGNYRQTGSSKIMGIGRELPALRLNGEEFPMELSLTEMVRQDQKFFIGIIRDISERKAATDKIYEMAYFDSLTQLPNRSSFERDLKKTISQSQITQYDIYCALLDIDSFTEFNLIYGKETGDRVLHTFAKQIQAVLPENFILYRDLADSFFLLYLLPISPEDEKIRAEILELELLIQQIVSRNIFVEQHTQSVSLSIGSLCIPTTEVNIEKIIQLLEYSSNQAKSKGLSKTVMLDKKARTSHERQTLLRHSMLSGLANDEFYIVLQPQYSLGIHPVASEALLRWNSKLFGNVRPDEFISLAEENGDILIIGDWVINEVCKLASKLKHQQICTRIAVNISAKQIVQPDFAQQLMQRLTQWDVPPSCLMLEITESTLVQNIELVRKQMLELSQHGLSFSIDDFGTGYSSLRYLKELPLNEIKIDRYFVEEITDENQEVTIVNTIIEMAKAMGVATVAEGIEDEKQLRYLTKRGCNYFQGFFLSRPLAVEKWLQLFLDEEQISLMS